MSAVPEADAGRRPVLRAMPSLRDAGTLIGLALIVVVFASLAPSFLTERNLINILQQSSINACIAIGMTLVIIQGGIDLSVGPVAALSAVLSTSLLVAGYPVPVAIAAGLLIGARIYSKTEQTCKQ
jgi:ribose transport system permease protein